jgi:hypothetical protein
MRWLIVLVSSPLVVAVLAWTAFAACVDAPVGEPPPIARLVVGWDPLACGAPHRIAVELADEMDGGAAAAQSAPCNAGGVTVDVAQRGRYRGRVYAWGPGAIAAAARSFEVTIDAPIVAWTTEPP